MTHDGAHDTARACADGTIDARTTRSAALGRHDDSLAARRSLGVASVGSDRSERASRGSAAFARGSERATWLRRSVTYQRLI